MLKSCAIDFGGNWIDIYHWLSSRTSYQRSIQMASFEALYGRKCRALLCWSDIEDKAKLICERLKAASDRHNSYANLKCRDIKYQVGDKVFLKVSPWKKVLRFRRKGKLSLRFIRTYDIRSSHVVPVEEIEVQSKLSNEEKPVVILDCEVKVPRNKTIPLVKVLRRNHKTEKATWESEDIMRHQYPYLFDLGKF
ncbi:uncharacterized protein LOC105789630 [Gossypium raimondii]|uniref:uncharacterized protein LOC105789630 n=1 Tax=Gossypium raimondii TaxID=29730 RepID=UPI00063A8E8C|nr:uncharacterized protein LOC105789630 [Gossypium raimondii]